MDHQLIVLTGFMSSGKTTLAAAVGRRLNADAIDLDEVITSSTGQTPKQIIEQQGESHFRNLETQFLTEVLEQGRARVISLGGGAWILERNRELISRFGGTSIWLDAPFDLCWRRIAAGGNERPLAVNEESARELYEKRTPVYSMADVRIEVTKDKGVDEVASEIISALSSTP